MRMALKRPSAPGRSNAMRLPLIALSPSIQPLFVAAVIVEYSPLA
jgi:hypothetical protein